MPERHHVRSLSPGNLLLLHAALDDGPGALEAWQGWFAQAGSLEEGIDSGEFRLLPLVYRNLKSQGFTNFKDFGRLQGIYRQTWYRNRIAEAALLEAIEAFQESGVESLALKGMALIGLAYQEPGVRPMNDIDLLVHGRDLRRAIGALEAAGWNLSPPRSAEFSRLLRLFHARALRHRSGIELDLHRHILEESNWSHADAGVWERRRTVELSNHSVETMSPTDHLIHTIVHGVRWDPIPPIRWVTDAVVLIRSGEIDWDLIAAESERRRVALAMGAALEFLSDEFGQYVPPQTLSRLNAATPSRLERIDFRFQQGGAGAIDQIGRYVTRYLRLTSDKSVYERARLFPLYLRAMWGLESAWQLPVDGLRRTWIRARGGDPGRT